MAGPTGTPPPLLPGVMQLAVHIDGPPCQATNVLHFICHETGGLGASDASNMALYLTQKFSGDLWAPVASHDATVTVSDFVYAEIEGQPNVKRGRVADGTIGIVTQPIDWGQTAYLINWDTGDPRRGGKPRQYLFGVTSTAESDPANVGSSFLTALASGISTFLGHVAGHTVGNLVCDNLIDYSRVNHGAYRSAGFYWPITAGTANPVIGTQRRRVGRVRA